MPGGAVPKRRRGSTWEGRGGRNEGYNSGSGMSCRAGAPVAEECALRQCARVVVGAGKACAAAGDWIQTRVARQRWQHAGSTTESRNTVLLFPRRFEQNNAFKAAKTSTHQENCGQRNAPRLRVAAEGRQRVFARLSFGVLQTVEYEDTVFVTAASALLPGRGCSYSCAAR